MRRLISCKWANRVRASLWAFLPSFLSVSMFLNLSLVFQYLSFLFIFVFFFLPFSPSILVILLWGHSYFLFFRLYCLLSPHPTTDYLYFSLGYFLVLQLVYTAFRLFASSSSHFSFFHFLLFPSLPLLCLSLSSIYFFPIFPPLISLFPFLYPFPGPLNFPLFAEVGMEPAGGSPPPQSDLGRHLEGRSCSPISSQPELAPFSVKSGRLWPGLTGKRFGQYDGRAWERQELQEWSSTPAARVEAWLVRRRPLSPPWPSHPVSPATSWGLGPSQDKRKCFGSRG